MQTRIHAELTLQLGAAVKLLHLRRFSANASSRWYGGMVAWWHVGKSKLLRCHLKAEHENTKKYPVYRSNNVAHLQYVSVYASPGMYVFGNCGLLYLESESVLEIGIEIAKQCRDLHLISGSNIGDSGFQSRYFVDIEKGRNLSIFSSPPG